MKRGLFILLVCFSACQGKPPSIENPQFISPVIHQARLALIASKMWYKNQEAIADFEKGIQEYTLEGTILYTDFIKFYDEYMLKKYNIVIKATCILDPSSNCYYNTMNHLILKKYGYTFIDDTWEAARKEFRKMGKDPDADN